MNEEQISEIFKNIDIVDHFLLGSGAMINVDRYDKIEDDEGFVKLYLGDHETWIVYNNITSVAFKPTDYPIGGWLIE